MLRKTKTLVISIIIFLIVAISSIMIILNKGYINGKSLISYESVHNLSIKCDKEYLSVSDNETADLTVTYDDEEIKDGYKIEVDKEDIVSIDSKTNKIKAKKIGNATITVKLDNSDLYSTVQVTVYKAVKSLKLTAKSSTLRVGNDRQLDLITTPSDATRTYITFESSDPDIATVNNNGIVTGVSKGTVTITATDSITGKTATVQQIVIK